MRTSHVCYWSHRRQSELTFEHDEISGAGVPIETLEFAAQRLGSRLKLVDDLQNEDDRKITILNVASGGIHDGCFFSFEPASLELKKAIVAAVFNLHATYLRATFDWSRVSDEIIALLTANRSVLFRSFPYERRLVIRHYPDRSEFLHRIISKRVTIDCSAPIAIFEYH